MKPGVRVIRGPDWKYGDEDGGSGFLGTIVNIYPNNTAKVCDILLLTLHQYCFFVQFLHVHIHCKWYQIQLFHLTSH